VHAVMDLRVLAMLPVGLRVRGHDVFFG
jgi:hypothetical protein